MRGICLRLQVSTPRSPQYSDLDGPAYLGSYELWQVFICGRRTRGGPQLYWGIVTLTLSLFTLSANRTLSVYRIGII